MNLQCHYVLSDGELIRKFGSEVDAKISIAHLLAVAGKTNP